MTKKHTYPASKTLGNRIPRIKKLGNRIKRQKQSPN